MALFAKWLSDNIGSTTAPITTDIASAKFMGFYVSNSATSGTSVGHYMRLYVTGTAGSGVAGRFYVDLTGVAGATAHGIQATCGTGESTTAGSCSGLGTGVYANIYVANATLARGTYAAVNAEIYTAGSSSSLATTTTSLVRLVNNGAGAADVDTYANIFEVVGFTSGAGAAYYDKGSAATGTLQGSLKVKTPAGIRYIPLYVTLT